ncbi:hypothetical protein [Neobacillus terrae]|uniref:hypothetical protein n=1 Tax=Neobacillus terrae TaxID=3034837 RepID=UPI001408C0F6|nr:hypothetical protein [Neobacillus terrae]NHM31113.1 hypothetical protein [Neobacillus terrae]
MGIRKCPPITPPNEPPMSPETNCETCTPPEGSTPILTVSVPGGLAINLLGIHVEACPICITVFTEGSSLTASQTSIIINDLLAVIRGLIPNVPGA